MKFRLATMALLLTVSSPALAEETAPPPDVTITGSVALVSDYRFRGVSQSDKGFAVQGSPPRTPAAPTWASGPRTLQAGALSAART